MNARRNVSNVKDGTRIQVYVPKRIYEHVRYWAEQHNQSISEYAQHALDDAIAQENGDYRRHMPDEVLNRLNELIDLVKSLDVNSTSMGNQVIMSLSSLLDLTRGDGSSYLSDAEPDGDEPFDTDRNKE